MPYSNPEEQKDYMREFMRLKRARDIGDIKKVAFWNNLRHLVLERDGYRCQFCHIAIKEVLTVHHVNQNHEDNRLENLKTLCFNCHFMLHSHPEALGKIEDWNGSAINHAMVIEILEAYERKRGKFRSGYCVFHDQRPSDVTLSYSLQTGKMLSPNRAFGLCRSCWSVLAENGETVLAARKRANEDNRQSQ